MTPEVVAVTSHRTQLGEGPLWDPRAKVLYYVDSEAPAIQRFDPATGRLETFPMPELIGSVVVREKGGLCAGLRSGFHFVDLEGGRVERVAAPEPDKPNNRLNDGKCDRAGRYWSGSMNMDLTTPTGVLWRLDPDRSCHKMDEGFIIVSNGIAFAPDNKTMYFSNSRKSQVFAYDFDLETGRIANRRLFFSTENRAGRVDGATVDAEGNYWCALIDGWAIGCVDPKGRLVREIKLPFRFPTMCSFGGDNLDVLYVTSGTWFLKPGMETEQPEIGRLFAIYNTGATGLPEPFFRG